MIVTGMLIKKMIVMRILTEKERTDVRGTLIKILFDNDPEKLHNFI